MTKASNENTFTYQFDVEGMTCAACVANVEKALSSVRGVKDISVNLATESARVISSEPLALGKLSKSVSRMGYRLEAQGTATLVERQQRTIKTWSRLLFIQMLFGIPLLVYAMLEMFHMLPNVSQGVNISLQLALATILVISGAGYYKRGFKHLILRVPNMDSLVAMGTGSAYIYSLIASLNMVRGWNMSGFSTLYFEAAGTILMFITLGKWLEALAKGKTTEALTGLMEQMPTEATVLRDGAWITLPLDQVKQGDTVRIAPHRRIPVDGIILKGSGAVDESAISGESLPVEKAFQDKVIGASMNLNGSLEIQATAIGRDSVFGQVIKLVEDAQSKKPEIQKLVDRVAAVFVPVVLLLALLAGTTWLILEYEFTFILNVMISVMIIACPCALGLATPTALVVASGIAARHGILIKSADAFQQLSQINTMVFDKTGTLTTGQAQVVETFPESNQEMISLAMGLEQHSQHPLARALLEYGRGKGSTALKMTEIVETSGLGMSGSHAGHLYSIRRLNQDEEAGNDFEDQIESWLARGYIVTGIFKNDVLIGIMAFSDQPKADSLHVVKSLTTAGIRSILATGDRLEAAENIARQFGITEVRAGVQPAEKHALIEGLQADGNMVGMLGDGINDAPALSAADVGISFRGSTDIAMNAADIIFMNDSLGNLLTARYLAVATIHKIKQNLFWAFFYNLIGIPIAMGVLYPFTGILLNPMFAGMAMAFSSVSVVTNTLFLKRKRF
jgi:Cu+-exporting ATPase